MKKKCSFLLLLLCVSVFSLQAQKRSKKEKSPKLQVTINATNLLRQATGIEPVIPVITSPYDLQLTYNPFKQINFRMGIGYREPEAETPTGAVTEAGRIDYTVHFRFGFSWNKYISDKWVWANGPDFVYSRRLEKEFMGEELSLHVITNDSGMGGSSNLQYYFTPQFSMGAEMGLYISVSVRDQLLPIVDPIDPFFGFSPFSFEQDTQIHARLYAPIELFLSYRF